MRDSITPPSSRDLIGLGQPPHFLQNPAIITSNVTDEKQLEILHQGPDTWNALRAKNPYVKIDLRGSNLSKAHLNGANLHGADISGANLRGVDLRSANLRVANLSVADLRRANLGGACLSEADINGANLRGADLREANLRRANLRGSNLRGASLRVANLSGADLSGANLSVANLRGANLSKASLLVATLSAATLREANLSGANLSRAALLSTVFANVDLSQTLGLDSCEHYGPSSIDYRTLAQSGPLPRRFLEGIGLPNQYIDYLPSLLNKPIQRESCFISYSHKDEAFTKCLYYHLRAANLEVWYAPEDIKGGRYLEDQIDRALQIHDRLLLVLSRHSMNSEWVKLEIRKPSNVRRKRNAASSSPSASSPCQPSKSAPGWTASSAATSSKKSANTTSPTSPTGKTTTPSNPKPPNSSPPALHPDP